MTAKKAVHKVKLPPKRKKAAAKPNATTKVTLHKADTHLINPYIDAQLLHKERARGSSGDKLMPYDLPMYIEVERAMGDFNHKTAGKSRGLYGHVVTLQPFTKVGMGDIKIKLYRDPNALRITVAGEEVFKWEEDPDNRPLKWGEMAARDAKIGGAWADQVNLQPGDEVIETDVEGIVDINRVDDDEFIEDEEDEIEWE